MTPTEAPGGLDELRDILFDDGIAHVTITGEDHQHATFVCRACILAVLTERAATAPGGREEQVT